MIKKQFDQLKSNIKLKKIIRIDNYDFAKNNFVLDVPLEFKNPFKVPIKNKKSYIMNCFKIAIDLAKKKKVAGFINCPINKFETFGLRTMGITEFLAKKEKEEEKQRKKVEKQVKENNQKKSFHMPKVEMPKMPDIPKVEMPKLPDIPKDIKTKFTSFNENIEKTNDKSKDTCPKDVPVNDKDASATKACMVVEDLPELTDDNSKQEPIPNDEDAPAEIGCMVVDDLPDGDVVSHHHEQKTAEDGNFEQCEDQFER